MREEYLARGADVVVIGEGELALDELLAGTARPRCTRPGRRAWHRLQGRRRRLRTHPGAAEDPGPGCAAACPTAAPSTCNSTSTSGAPTIGMGSVNLITARGCPYKCTWCSHAVYGYSHRGAAPANVVAEVAGRSSSATSPSSCGTRMTCSPSATHGSPPTPRRCVSAGCACPSRRLRAPTACRPRPPRQRWPSSAATAYGSARKAAASASSMPCGAT